MNYALKQLLRTYLTLSAFCLLAAPDTLAAEWGTLKGRFVYEGDAKRPAIEPTKDTEFCSKYKLYNEEVVVGEDNALQNVFVYLYLNLRRGETVDIHPDYLEAEVEPAVLDNQGCRFAPHAMTVWTRRPLEIRNSDEGIGHNTNAQTLFNNPKFNEQVANGSPIVKEFDKAESYPAEFACNVHPWMKGYVLIRDNPYMAVTDEKGEFEIKNIPAGEHKFVFWHEAKGNIRDLSVGDDETDRRGTATLEIPAGETLDLGEIKITPDHLGK